MVTDFQHTDSGNSFQPARACVKVLNFGMAAYILESYEWTGRDAIWGNLIFTAPESMKAPSIFECRGDIFSLGCTLYFLWAGERPFPNRPDKLAEKEIPATLLNEIAPWIDKECVRVVHKMIARDVEHRYQNCAEVVKALECCSTCERIDSHAKSWWRFRSSL